jgi:apolipoprotein N-acyltransferase
VKTFIRLAQPIVLAWGFRRALIAFLAGAASTLAITPVNTDPGSFITVWPVMFVTIPVAVWLLDGAAAGRFGGIVAAAVTGWWFGFGYFLAGLYWIGQAFLVDAKDLALFVPLMPIAVVGLPAYLALYTALGFALARALWTRGALRILTFAAALTLAEWLRGHLLTGFPWNAFGYSLTTPLVLAQCTALFGVWGLTFIAVAAFASPAVLADERADTRWPWLAPATAVVVLVAIAIYGTVRLATTPTTYVDGVRLRIMQPNVPQDEKFSYANKAQVMQHYLALSDRATGPNSAGVASATLLIWPESAFPFFLTREPDALAQIAALLHGGPVLITGAARAADLAPATRDLHAYNSVYVIDRDGTILSVYDKVHLVPFGEYLPFQRLLERLGLRQLTRLQGGFLAGDRRRLLAPPHVPKMLPLICYEIIFPNNVLPEGERPGWMLNLTNDAWFGESAGPYQHFQQARVRAIEEGLPLVRAANTGISAVVDPVGRIIHSLALGSEGVFDSALPQAIGQTVYGRWGDIPLALLVATILLIAAVRRMQQ